MSNIVIKVEDVSKQYRLGTVGTGSLMHDINRSWHRMRGKADPYLKIGESNDRTVKGNSEYVWALQDINFDVRQGEVLGIIGRNGAGKSTLLKILSRTTTPTTGSIKIKGRIASLLEVGTGFHPELSGRENIFLNGAILGMTRHEIKSKFDEIVDFAGVERYIDTPVKRYSSGMYVRLAFGVAAHLEPEILIVDEVLAVGDTEFQKKALGKMKDVSNQQGRTVLFVSHNMAAMQSLCTQCIYMKDGKIHYGPNETEVTISEYIKSYETNFLNTPISERKDREGEGNILIQNIVILDEKENVVTNLIAGQKIYFKIFYDDISGNIDNAPLEIAISISQKNAHLVTVLSTKYLNADIRNDGNRNYILFEIERVPLMTGSYSLNASIKKNGVMQDWIKEAIFFDVENGDYYRTGSNIPESHRGVYTNYNIK